MTTFRDWGQAIRVAPSLPPKMQSFDAAVMVPMQDPAGGPPSLTAVVARNRGMVAMRNLAFEHPGARAAIPGVTLAEDRAFAARG
jgi:hypothetical protein